MDKSAYCKSLWIKASAKAPEHKCKWPVAYRPVGVSPHAQHPGEPLKEEGLHPGGHGVVGGRGAVVHVDDEDRDDDGEGDEDHDEEEVLPDQRDDLEEIASCHNWDYVAL